MMLLLGPRVARAIFAKTSSLRRTDSSSRRISVYTQRDQYSSGWTGWPLFGDILLNIQDQTMAFMVGGDACLLESSKEKMTSK